MIERCTSALPHVWRGVVFFLPWAETLVVFCSSFLGVCAADSREKLPLLTQAAAVRKLSIEESKRRYPVRLRGVITCYRPEERLCFIQDESAGIYVYSPRYEFPIKTGQLVELEGFSGPGDLNRVVTQPKFTILNATWPMPAPRSVTFKQLLSGSEDCQRVEIRGVIQSADEENGRITILLRDRADKIRISALKPASATPALSQLIDAEARVRGVGATRMNSRRELEDAWIALSDLRDLRIEVPQPENPFDRPGRAIAAIVGLDPTEIPSHAVKLDGAVTNILGPQSFVLRDATGAIQVGLRRRAGVRLGDRLEALGFVRPSGGSNVVEQAVFRTVSPSLASTHQSLTNQSAAVEYLPVLRRAKQITDLPANEVNRGYPVRLRAIVTYYDGEAGELFVQDDSGGIAVATGTAALNLKLGHEIELDGYSQSGSFAPIVVRPEVRVLGPKEPPPPQKLSIGQLANNSFGGHWIELQGVVRSVARENGQIRFELSQQGLRTKAWLPRSTILDERAMARFVNAAVRVRGVSAPRFDDHKQWLGFHVMTADVDQVVVQNGAPSDPFAGAARTIAQVQVESPKQNDHRVKIEGVVTFVRQGELLCLSDATGAMFVHTRQSDPLEVGDRLEVAGFVVQKDVAAELQEAVYRKVGVAELPLPESLTARQVLNRHQHGKLVRLQGRLLDQTVRPKDAVLVVEDEGCVFAAVLDAERSNREIEALREGSILQLTGVCLVELEGNDRAETFVLRLRSPADVTVLKAPSWWTGPRMMATAGSTAALALVALTWVVALRRRVREQTELIRIRLQREAALEEEHRELFENATDIVYTHDLAGQYTSVNRAGERILGYTREEILKLNGFDIIAPESREQSRQMLQRKLSEGGSTTYEVTFIAKSGHRIVAEVCTRLIQRDGKVVGVHGIARDITERKRAERLSNAFSILGRRLSTARTREEAATIIIEVADGLAAWDACYLHLFTHQGESLVPVINIDTIDGRRVAVENAYGDMSLSAMDRKVLEHGPTLILRQSEDEAEPGLIPFGNRGRRSASLMFVPVRNGGEVVGVLSIQSYTRGAYSESDLQTLQALGDQCGGALERIRAETALRESELRYRTLTETSPVGIWQTTPEGHTIFLNPGMCAILEIDRPEEMGRRTYRDFYTTASIETVQREHRTRLSGISSTYEVEIVGARGGRRNVLICGAPILNPNGSIHSFIATLIDITSRRQAEQALRDSEEQYRRVVEGSIQGIAIHQESLLQFVNPAFARIFGYDSPQEMVGRNIWDVVASEYHPVLKARVFACLRGESLPVYHGWRGLRKDGRAIWIQSGAAQISWKGKPAVLASLVDVTEQRQAEDALRQSEEQFSKAFHTSPIPISISTVAEGKYITVNDSFLKLFGFGRSEILGRNSMELGIWILPEDRARLIDELESTGSVRDLECKLRTKAGDERTILISAEFLHLNEEACVLALLYDVTERLNLETQLRHAQKLEAVGQLAAGVAHDFNNIMTIVQGHASLLLSAPNQSERLTESLREISLAADRAANLTRQLLAFSRKQIMQPRPAQLNTIIGGMSNMLRRLMGESIVVQFRHAANLPAIWADVTMIEQIVMNLALNARDAMSDGGQLIIRTSETKIDAAALRQHPDAGVGQYVCLTVTDTGCGMDKATLARIFEPFFTTKDVGKGTGLGLATVYGIVKQHRGWIETASEIGNGTTMAIYLPAICEPLPPQPDEVCEPAPQFGHETVMLVEDEPALRNLIGQLLHRQGYRILAYASGIEALKAWDANREKIDLLLTDIIMPGGVSGHDLARRLHIDKPDLKVIFTSGYSLEFNHAAQSLPAGAMFLAKPYSPSKLVAMVRYCLDGTEGQRDGSLSTDRA